MTEPIPNGAPATNSSDPTAAVGAGPDSGPGEVLAPIAVLGRADEAALEFLVGQDGEGRRGSGADERLLVVAGHPDVHVTDASWTISEDAAAAILADLEQHDLPRFRQLHERAIEHLAARLRAGEVVLEESFLAILDRLASRLFLDDPDAFRELVASVADVPLDAAPGRQLRRYFEGVALAVADRFSEALAAFERVLAEPELDEHVRGRALNSHAVYCRVTGRLEEAVTGYQASLEVWRRLGSRLREGLALLNLGIAHYELQDYAQGEHRLSAATECFEAARSARWLAASQNELGLVYRDQARWAEALRCFDAAATRYRAEGAMDLLGRVLLNTGEVLLFQGRLGEALVVLHQALASMRTRIYAVDVHLHIGLVFQAAGRLADARAAFQDALDLALAIGRRDILAEAHYRLGDALRQQGQATAALAQLEAAAAVIEATREPVRDEGLKISLFGRWQPVYEALVLQCLVLGHTAAAFEWAERARARAFADAALARPTRVASAAEVQAALPADTALLCYFTTGVLERGTPLLRAVPRGSPLGDLLRTPARTLLFVLTRDRLAVHECWIDPNAFASSSPRQGELSRFLCPDMLRQLHALLLEPAATALEAKRLVIVPHGPLHQVPFAALTDASGRHCLRDGGPCLTFAPSATLLLRHCLPHVKRPPNTRRQPCLAIGYSGSQSQNGNPEQRAVPQAEAEAASIARLTGGEAWLGPRPKLEQLRLVAGKYRWLHFACHGEFDPDTPLLSYLQTGAGELLTAEQVLASWHLEADLVTLAACRTAKSGLLRGDEPMGLVRAFLVVGSRAALVTQWPVQDLSTFLLMRRFYGELLRQRACDPAAALHAAQLWLRGLTSRQARLWVKRLARAGAAPAIFDGLERDASDSRPYADPRHWAAFVLVGA